MFVTTPSTSRKKRKQQSDMYTLPSANQTNMPNSPTIVPSVFHTEAEMKALQDLGYDSDGYLPSFMDPDKDFDFDEHALLSIVAEARNTNVSEPPQPDIAPLLAKSSNHNHHHLSRHLLWCQLQ
jgi:hypothetical protein